MFRILFLFLLFQHVFTLSVSLLVGVEGQSVEICNTVDIRGETNREIAMRITSDLNSKDRFFTDLNGYQVEAQYVSPL